MEEDFKIIRQAIRDEIRFHPVLIPALKRFAKHEAVFYPGYGNLGDALIAVGTCDFFHDIHWSPKHIYGNHKSVFSGHNYVVMGGGGGWVKGLWEMYREQTLEFLKNGGKMLILPSSFSGFGAEFVPYANQLMIFCREQQSYDDLLKVGLPEDRLFLCHDLAFYTKDKHFSDLQEKGKYPVLKILRRDEESVCKERPRDSVDLPLLFNGIQWATLDECLPPLRAVAGLMNQFASVETDRLHMAILATMLGRSVKVEPSNYFKIKAVFEYTLHRFATVSFQKQASGHSELVQKDRDEIKKLKLELQAEWEQRAIVLRKNDALSEKLRNLREEFNAKNQELKNFCREKDVNFDYICQELDSLSRKNSEEIENLKKEIKKIHSSRLYQWSQKYYSFFRLPVVGIILRGIRRIVVGAKNNKM